MTETNSELFMKQMKPQTLRKLKIGVRDLVLVAVMAAVIEAAKLALSFLPNVELVTLLITLYTRHFKGKILYAIPIFVAAECALWGFGTWTIMYAYIWLIPALFSYLFRKQDSLAVWCVIDGAFGLFFGALCSIVYLFAGGPAMAVAWWISGIPYDLIHCVSNIALVLVLFRPLDKVLGRFCRTYMTASP